jgi:hypothetical protein
MKLKVQQRSIGTLLVLETHSALYLVPNWLQDQDYFRDRHSKQCQIRA